MKKFIALLIAITMCSALFCIVSNADADPDTWLCKEAKTYGTGWWINTYADPKYADGDVEVVFTTPNAFDGFKMACFAEVANPAVIEVVLSDGKGNELEIQEITVTGDHNSFEQPEPYIYVEFDNAYAAGTYTIDLMFAGGAYFVLGQGEYNELQDDIYVDGLNVVNGDPSPAQAPAIMLTGADPASVVTTEAETTTEAESTT